MDGNRAPWRRAGLAIAAMLLLGACSGHHLGFGSHDGEDGGIHAFPDHYKADILAAMHAYLNDPTGIRDASISEPMLKSVPSGTRYLVCLRFNGKQNNGTYAGESRLPPCSSPAGSMTSSIRVGARAMQRRGLYAVSRTEKLQR